MKGKGEVKGWITRHGVHVPIYGDYTVRGGVEPKAKSAKVKGLKKKPDKYTNPRTGKRDHVQGKTQNDLNKSLKEQGLVLDAAYQRSEDGEKVLMYDNDGNVYTGNFNKYNDGGREITHIELDKKAKKVAPGQVTGKNTKRKRGMTADELDAANKELDAKDAADDIKNYESTHPIKKGKKKPEHEVIDRTTPQGDYDTKSGDERKQRLIDYIARKEGLDEAAATERYENMRLSERDVMGYEAFKEESRAARAKMRDTAFSASNEKYVQTWKDKKAQEQGFADDAKRYGYSEQTEEGKKPVTKAEESAKASKQESSRYHDKMTTPYKDLNDKQKSFVKELAEERAGHKLSDEGVQFYQDLENDERAMRQTEIAKRKPIREIPRKESKAGSRYKTTTKNFGMEPSASELGNAYTAANNAKSKFAGMSAAKLKSLYANALGAERGAIYQLLKAKGYTYKDGKWSK